MGIIINFMKVSKNLESDDEFYPKLKSRQDIINEIELSKTFTTYYPEARNDIEKICENIVNKLRKEFGYSNFDLKYEIMDNNGVEFVIIEHAHTLYTLIYYRSAVDILEKGGKKEILEKLRKNIIYDLIPRRTNEYWYKEKYYINPSDPNWKYGDEVVG